MSVRGNRKVGASRTGPLGARAVRRRLARAATPSPPAKSHEFAFALIGLCLGVFTAVPTAILIFDRFFVPVPPIEFSALDRIDGDFPNVAASPYPQQIGMLHNRIVDASGDDVKVDNAERENEVAYAFESPKAGTYNLRILYAIHESRPIEIYVNDIFVVEALDENTPCEHNNCRMWSRPICVELQNGTNHLRLYREKPFPHLIRNRFEFERNCEFP